jgi:hypothetical protein
MVMEPVLLLGTVLGVFFNAISPGWLITILLVLCLTYTTYRTTIKAFETFDKEMKAEKEEEQQRLLPAGSKDAKHKHMSYTPQQCVPALRTIYEEESRVNWTSIGILVSSWLIIAVFSILKGGEGGKGVVDCGTAGYWVLVLCPVPLIVVIVWKAGEVLATRHEEKLHLLAELRAAYTSSLRLHALVA